MVTVTAFTRVSLLSGMCGAEPADDGVAGGGPAGAPPAGDRIQHGVNAGVAGAAQRGKIGEVLGAEARVGAVVQVAAA